MSPFLCFIIRECWRSSIGFGLSVRLSMVWAPPTNVGRALFFQLVRPSVHGMGPANECWRSSIVFCLSVHLSVFTSVCPWSLSVIFYGISSKLHIWIAFSNLSFRFEYGFCPTSDNQDDRQNGRHLSISAVVVTLTQSFLIRFLPNFIYEFASIILSFKFEYGFCLTSHNQDGPQNGCRLSNVCCRGHSLA